MVASFRPDKVIEFFLNLSHPYVALDPAVYSASNGNESDTEKMFLGSRPRPARKAV